MGMQTQGPLKGKVKLLAWRWRVGTQNVSISKKEQGQETEQGIRAMKLLKDTATIYKTHHGHTTSTKKKH